MDKTIDTTTALKLIKEELFTAITLPTLISWCTKYGLGKKVGGRWYINKKSLISFVKNGTP